MRSRAFRPIATILSILLLAGSPVHAGPVALTQVTQALGRYRNSSELRLRAVPQTALATVSGVTGSTRTDSRVDKSVEDPSVDTPNTTAKSPDSLLSGVTVNADELRAGVDVIDQGNIEGTVCDCGEITVPGGGFPKWPLLFLAAIPFFFIHSCDDCETPPATPKPPTPLTPLTTPTPPQPSDVPGVPEPGSLLLFGSGLAALGAGWRRRHARAKLAAQIAEEG